MTDGNSHVLDISHNGGWFSSPTAWLYTSRMPAGSSQLLGYSYESCLFTSAESEVVGTYHSLSEAVSGHSMLRKRYGLK